MASISMADQFDRIPERYSWYVLILPKLLFLAAVFLVPAVFSLFISFYEWNPLSDQRVFVGLQHYVELFNDPWFWAALQNTTVYTIAMVVGNVLLALGIALLLDKQLRGTRIYSGLIFLPVVASMASVSVIWALLYNPGNGFFNVVLTALGLPTYEWLRNPAIAMLSVYVMSLWKRVPFNMVIFLAGLQGIPSRYYEAAKIDGAYRWARFRYVTIPLLKPTIAFVAIIQMIFSMRMFTQVFVLTQGGPGRSTTTIVYYYYQQAFQEFNFGYGAAISVIAFVIVFLLSIGQDVAWGEFHEY